MSGTSTKRRGTSAGTVMRARAVRIIGADGPQNAGGQHLSGDAAWLVGEWRDTGSGNTI